MNDVTKSLNCCGSLVIVDEEYSTVHFAHSSVKQYLETIDEKSDLSEYHIVPKMANLEMGKIIVTYLNLDILQGQLTHNKKASQIFNTQDRSILLGAGLPLPAAVSSNLARRLLKNRKTPQLDLQHELEKVAGLTKKSKELSLQANALLPYAQQHWLPHTQSFEALKPSRSYELWVRLVEGGVQIMKSSWTSEDAQSLNARFLDSVARSSSSALIQYALYKLDRGEMKEIYGSTEIRKLLMLLPPRNFSKNHDLLRHKEYGMYEDLLWRGVNSENVDIVTLLLDKTPVDVNTIARTFGGTVLHAALFYADLKTVQILLKHGANVNATGGSHGSAMEIAATSSIAEQVIPLLLGAGAKEIPILESYSQEVKQLLRPDSQGTPF